MFCFRNFINFNIWILLSYGARCDFVKFEGILWEDLNIQIPPVNEIDASLYPKEQIEELTVEDWKIY